jgi:hypothetical protein
MVLEFTGAGTDFSNFQAVAAATGTSHTANMAAYASGSQVVGFVVTNAGQAMPPPSDFTEIYDNNPVINTRVQLQYASGATAPTTITWTTSNSATVAFGLEVKEPGSTEPPTGSSVTKVWTGGAWHPSTVKVYTGGAWVTKPLKARKGSSWY